MNRLRSGFVDPLQKVAHAPCCTSSPRPPGLPGSPRNRPPNRPSTTPRGPKTVKSYDCLFLNFLQNRANGPTPAREARGRHKPARGEVGYTRGPGPRIHLGAPEYALGPRDPGTRGTQGTPGTRSGMSRKYPGIPGPLVHPPRLTFGATGADRRVLRSRCASRPGHLKAPTVIARPRNTVVAI